MLMRKELVAVVNKSLPDYRLTWDDIKQSADGAIIRINKHLGTTYPMISDILATPISTYSYAASGVYHPYFPNEYIHTVVVPYTIMDVLAKDEEFTTLYNKCSEDLDDGLFTMFQKEFNRIPFAFRENPDQGVFFASESAKEPFRHNFKDVVEIPEELYKVYYHVNNNDIIMRAGEEFVEDTLDYRYGDSYELKDWDVVMTDVFGKKFYEFKGWTKAKQQINDRILKPYEDTFIIKHDEHYYAVWFTGYELNTNIMMDLEYDVATGHESSQQWDMYLSVSYTSTSEVIPLSYGTITLDMSVEYDYKKTYDVNAVVDIVLGTDYTLGKDVSYSADYSMDIDIDYTLGKDVSVVTAVGVDMYVDYVLGKDVSFDASTDMNMSVACVLGKDVSVTPSRGINISVVHTLGKDVSVSHSRDMDMNVVYTLGKDVDVSPSRDMSIAVSYTLGKNISTSKSIDMDMSVGHTYSKELFKHVDYDAVVNMDLSKAHTYTKVDNPPPTPKMSKPSFGSVYNITDRTAQVSATNNDSKTANIRTRLASGIGSVTDATFVGGPGGAKIVYMTGLEPGRNYTVYGYAEDYYGSDEDSSEASVSFTTGPKETTKKPTVATVGASMWRVINNDDDTATIRCSDGTKNYTYTVGSGQSTPDLTITPGSQVLTATAEADYKYESAEATKTLVEPV